MKKRKICFVTTISATMISFVVETAKYLHETMDCDVTLICSPDDAFAASLPEYLHFIPVRMNRGMDMSALNSILEFIRIFRQEQFDLVQYSTPNAACYASIAARIVNVPIRLYAQWGIRYTGMSGLPRRIFRAIEKMACQNSTHIRSVSPMNRAFGISEKLYKGEKVSVVGNGGTIGVDMKQYDIAQKNIWRASIRQRCGLEADDMVFGFVGRICADKGVLELLQAFHQITSTERNVRLLIVGSEESDGSIDAALLQWARESDKVVFAGEVDSQDIKRYYSAMDVLVHPTYREGFGMVIQEAGAMAVPVITTRIPGASEVMADGESCLLVEPKKVDELKSAMELLCRESALAARLGQAAYERTKTLYDRPVMLRNQYEDYQSLFALR